MKRLRSARGLGLIVAGICIHACAGLLADDWNQWLGPDRNGTWSQSGVIDSFPAEGLTPVWRQPIAAGFSGPAVAGDRVFVADYVHKEGDATFNASVRSKLKGTERVHCFNRETGEPIWQKSYERPYNISYALGPRATPTVDDDKVFVLGAEGDLRCHKVVDGEVVWELDLKKEYHLEEAPMWGYAAHPLVHGDHLYCMVGGKGSIAVAFNKNTGKEIWRSLSSKDAGYCPPTLINAGGTDQLLIFHPTALVSLDPKTGKQYWSVKMSPAYGQSIIAPIKHGDYLLATALQGGSVLLKLDSEKPAVTEVWRGNGVSPDHNPPILVDNHIYGIDVKGRLRCCELVSGKRVWESLATCHNGRPAGSTTGFMVRNGDRWYIVTEQGKLIVAKMSPAGFEELGRTQLVEPTTNVRGRNVVWSHPAFAGKCMFARNDKEIVCYSLAIEKDAGK